MEGYQKNIADHMLLFRKICAIKQEDLAQMSGLSMTQLRNIEHGRANPTLSTLALIATTLELPMGKLLSPCDVIDTKIRFLFRRLGYPAPFIFYRLLATGLRYLLENDTDLSHTSLTTLFRHIARQHNIPLGTVQLSFAVPLAKVCQSIPDIPVNRILRQRLQHCNISETITVLLELLK